MIFWVTICLRIMAELKADKLGGMTVNYFYTQHEKILFFSHLTIFHMVESQDYLIL